MSTRQMHAGMPQIGDPVRLKGTKLVSKVIGYLPDVRGGVILDVALDGFRCWNAADLVILKRKRKG
jgi:hypothetical protein